MAAEATTAEPDAAGPETAPALPPKKASGLAIVVEMAFLTCFAVGAGGLFGMLVLGGAVEHVGARPEPAAAHGKKTKSPETASVRQLPAIVTNLASPQKTWIRLEASLAFADSAADSNELAAAIAEDVVALLRTVPVGQLEGPSALLHLREDLNERVRVRSGGKVRELIIQSLVLE
jgi:flagellar FliL protein